ncbi:hypothetical protein NC651_018271 [Populus alba x Populus x berolinensis]|nr:hypothetical protein NC651_018271 [Populus alba x Populus x berolinensis]
MSLTMKGGRHFTVYDPIIVISTQNEIVYCLAVVKSTELNIIGQNFMTGYRVVFDREKLAMMWRIITNSQCKPHASMVPPAVAAGLDSNSSTGSAKEASNKSPSSIASTYCYSHTSTSAYTKLNLKSAASSLAAVLGFNDLESCYQKPFR